MGQLAAPKVSRAGWCTAEIVWPLAVIALGIFTVSGSTSELAVATPAEPGTWVSDPQEQPSTPEEGCAQYVSKTSENVTARLLYVPAGTVTAAERSAESLLQTREFRATVMGVSLTPSSRSTVNVGLVSGTTGSYVAERDRFKPATVAPNSAEFRNGAGPYRPFPPDRKGRVLFCLWEYIDWSQYRGNRRSDKSSSDSRTSTQLGF